MKWQNQRKKVEALSLQATLLSAHSDALKMQLHERTIEQLKKPETLIWAFAAGVFWYASPATKRVGRAQTVLRFASTSSYILKLLGVPLPVRPPF